MGDVVVAAVRDGADEGTATALATKQVKSAVRSLSKNTVMNAGAFAARLDFVDAQYADAVQRIALMDAPSVLG